MAETFQEFLNRTPANTSLVPETEATEPLSTDTYRYTKDVVPTREDAERIAQTKYNISSHNALMGTLASAGVEMGTGIGMTVFATRMAKNLKWINRAKNVALAGVVTPEPTSSVAGAIAFGASEAAIWGFSNFLGQTTRKQMGIQDHYSGGEMIASAVFGTAVAASQATKLIELAPSLASMKAWKSAPIRNKLGKSFMTGASLGVAESLLRQEIQLVLNERENRDVMDYMFSGAAGGTFNSLFSVFGRTGAWGLMKAADSAESARKIAEESLRKAEQITNPRKRAKEIKKWKDAIDALTEIEVNFRGAENAERDYRKNAPEPEQVNNPSGDPRQAPALDPKTKPRPKPKPDEPEPEPKPDEPEPEPKPDEPEPKPDEPEPEAETDAPKLSKRRLLINSFAERFRNLGKINPNKLGIDFPNLKRDVTRLREEMLEEFQYKTEDVVARYQAGKEIEPDEIDELLKLIDDTRANNEVDARMKAVEGRGMQADRGDSARYVWETETSLRAVKEDSALFDMQESLLKIKAGQEAPSLEKQLDMLIDNTDVTNAVNYEIYVRGEKTKKEFDAMSPEKKEIYIQNRTAKLIQNTTQSLTRQLEKQRAMMMEGMNVALNQTQRDNLKKEVEKRMKENPTIQMLEKQIEYYKGAEAELNVLNKERKELARLAAIYGESNMTQLRKEIEVKDRVNEAPTELQKIRKQQAQLKAEMRKKIKEIDKAKEEIDNPISFAEKRIPKLEKELQELREIRSGQRTPKDNTKPSRAKTDKELDLEARIKFYKDEVREIKALEKKEVELNRLIELETKGTLGQIRDEFETKPKLLSEPATKLDGINKKIADAKFRLRSKVKEIDKAKLEQDKYDFFLSMQSHAMRNIEADSGHKLVQFGRDVRAARRLALIDQLPSILAGVPTGVGLAMRAAIRPWAMAPLDFARYGGDTAAQLFKAEFNGLFTSILNWNGTLTSMGRTFQRGNSATDRVMSKYMEDTATKNMRMGNNPTLSRAIKTAENRVMGKNDPMNTILDFRNNGGWALLSLGVRGIGAVDDGFRRQLLRGRLETAARRKAIMEHPDNPKLAEETYNDYMKTMWREHDGLTVLRDYNDFVDDVNDINQNLLFSARTEDPEMFHINAGEQLIKWIGKGAKDDNALAFLIDAFMPYISVPIRGVYRGARFAVSPAVGIKAAVRNPYQQKIKTKQGEIDIAEHALLGMDETNPQFAGLTENVKNLTNDIEILKARKVKYNEDAVVDTAFGAGLLALGYGAAMVGEATGSLNWMTKDQKEKNKMQPFKVFDMDYSAAAPWAIPIAIGADLAAYTRARDEGVLNERQGPMMMLSSTLVELSEQVPMMQGFKTFNAIVGGGTETKAVLLGRLAASYVPLPAQVRKTVMASTEDGTVGDLRGGNFKQRAAYAFLGIKPVNRKTDYFGEDINSNKTWVQSAIIRQAPSAQPELDTEFERVVASDIYDNIMPPPSSLGHRLKMTSFIDEEGITLQYAYAQRLRSHRKVYKGKKRTMKQAVNHLISSKKWRSKYSKATISKSLQHTNEGLRELNKLMQDYYMDVRLDIINDDSFTKRFVNSSDENLYDLVRRKDTQILGNMTPMRELLQLN